MSSRLRFKIAMCFCTLAAASLLVAAAPPVVSTPSLPASLLTLGAPAATCGASTPASVLVFDFPSVEMVNRPCCLDEWQGGGLCQPGQRIASYCDAGCVNCGVIFCYSGLCYR